MARRTEVGSIYSSYEVKDESDAPAGKCLWFGSPHKMLKRLQDENLYYLLKWWDAPDSTGIHEQLCKDRIPGTGQWLIQQETFREWKATDNSILWVHGDYGMGKTFLSTAIIEHLWHEPDVKFTALVYIYVRQKDSITMHRLLRSIILQLALQNPTAMSLLQEFFTQNSHIPMEETSDDDYSDTNSSEPTPKGFTYFAILDLLRDILEEIASNPDSASDSNNVTKKEGNSGGGKEIVYIILDGIEDMSNNDHESLNFAFLESITQRGVWHQTIEKWNVPNLRICVSSATQSQENLIVSLPEVATHVVCVAEGDEGVMTDIGICVDCFLGRMGGCWNEGMRKRAKEGVLEECQGRFEHVRELLDELEDDVKDSSDVDRILERWNPPLD